MASYSMAHKGLRYETLGFSGLRNY